MMLFDMLHDEMHDTSGLVLVNLIMEQIKPYIVLLGLRGRSAPDKQAVDSIASANNRDSWTQGNALWERSNIGK